MDESSTGPAVFLWTRQTYATATEAGNRSVAGEIASLGGDVGSVLESVGFPAYVIDRNMRVRALNAAAREIVGDVRGKIVTSVVAPEDQGDVRQRVARKLLKPTSTDFEVRIRDLDGNLRALEISSISLIASDGHTVVGIFGLGRPLDQAHSREHVDYHLTPRQREVLGYLVQGLSTEAIAARLNLSKETVRNHVRRLLRALHVHSRLEAVTLALREGIVVI